MLHLGTGPEYASQTFAAKERISYRETDSTVYRRMQELNAGRMDETALICYDKKMSYRTLIEQADRIADLLTTLGVRKDDLIMLAGEGCAQTVSILLACSKIGVGIMMLQPKTPEALKIGACTAAASLSEVSASDGVKTVEEVLKLYELYKAEE